jgi:uncharacterized protein involved in oxidation of intracellular sulfur
LNDVRRKEGVMRILIILNDAPYGSERSYNGLRLAQALAKHAANAEITIFLMADAVLCAKRGQKTPAGFYNLELMLKQVLSTAATKVLLCGMCMNARGLGDSELVEGARRSTMEALAEATLASDKVLVF